VVCDHPDSGRVDHFGINPSNRGVSAFDLTRPYGTYGRTLASPQHQRDNEHMAGVIIAILLLVSVITLVVWLRLRRGDFEDDMGTKDDNPRWFRYMGD
jgi:hypothetical protein